MTMVQNRARKVQSYFVQRERTESGERYYCLRDDAPDDIRDLAMEAHGTDMLPDDFRYEVIAHALVHVSTVGTLDDYDPSCDVYTGALLAYLGSSGDRLGRANEALADGSAATIEAAAMVAQCEEAAEVVYRLADALNDLEEEEEEEEDTAITDEQVERFEREAGEAGDLEAVAICRRALAGDDLARAEVAGWIAVGEAMRDGDGFVEE